jgi:hypothetical protein
MIVCFTNRSFSQSVKAEVDRDKILIGEQIQLKLTVENASSIGSWFDLPDSINHIEVVERKKIDTIDVGGITNYQQIIIITSFDSGQWQIPVLSVKGVGQPTQAITIDVLPVDVSKLKDYNEIKDIEEVEPQSSWLIITILAIATVLSLVIIWWLYKRKKRVVAPLPVLRGNQTPLQWAHTELDKLQQQNLYFNNKVKQHYSQLIDIARTYFHLQLRHASMHQTTDEWMVRLQAVSADTQVKTSFFQLLRLSETVKFAKYLPPAEDNEQSVGIARQMINNVAAASEHAAYQPTAS